uniref:G-protein coupled receptors family 1 profile domain-containing protein n=1 Tax=Pseudonaja textilis TaxID=8673 RepID=A0A670YVD4_PSETE
TCLCEELRRASNFETSNISFYHKLSQLLHGLVDLKKRYYMECPNQTAPHEFMLSGFSYPQRLKLSLIIFFSIMFILTLFRNSLIIGVVISDLQLHKPMYWFLCHLSILDMAFSSVVVPKVIAGFIPGGKVISFKGCVTQLDFFSFPGMCRKSSLHLDGL